MAFLLSHRLPNGLVAPRAYHRIAAVDVAVHRRLDLPADMPLGAAPEPHPVIEGRRLEVTIEIYADEAARRSSPPLPPIDVATISQPAGPVDEILAVDCSPEAACDSVRDLLYAVLADLPAYADAQSV